VLANFIEIIPIGFIEPGVIRHLQEIIQVRFDIKPSVAMEHTLPAGAYNSVRQQYNSQNILIEINNPNGDGQTLGSPALKKTRVENKKRLAVIDQDIYSDGLNYVFGQAILNGSCALISLSRLRAGAENATDFSGLFLSRVEKEAVHELGHVYGLRHCPNSTCVMYLSGDISDTDDKSSSFCPRCSFLPAAAGFRRMS
jgi:archaemetzincin